MKIVYVIEWRKGKDFGMVDDIVYESEAVADHVYNTLIGQMMHVTDDIEYWIKRMVFVTGDIQVLSRHTGEKK